jgi:hypothetical protein
VPTHARDTALLFGVLAFVAGAGIAVLRGVPCDVAALRGTAAGAAALVLTRVLFRLAASLVADAAASRARSVTK